MFIPFFIQLFVKEILNLTDFGEKECTINELSRAINQSIFGQKGNEYYDWYKNNLKRELLTQEYEIAKEILTLTCTKEITSKKELQNIFVRIKKSDDGFTKLINILKNGFYIREFEDNKFCMHNKILKSLWKKGI